MSKLSAFLHPVQAEEKEVVISDRFKDENGNVVPFKIRPITQEQADALTKQCTRVTRDKSGREVRSFDSARFSRALIIAGTVEPDFADAELCEAYGCLDPQQVPAKMLLAGEYSRLGDAIAMLSGLNDSAEEEAKN